MKTEYLTYNEQRLIAEDLYNISDSIEACDRLEKNYNIKIKPGRSVKLNSFARKLDKTRFLNSEIEKAIKRHSGHKVSLRKL